MEQDVYMDREDTNCTLEGQTFPYGYQRCKGDECIMCNDGNWEESDSLPYN